MSDWGSYNGRYKLIGKKAFPVEDLMEWATWFETADRRVALTETGQGQVSTVFLGLDHNFGDGPDPILFETMVFGGPLDGEQMRYSTWEEAERGHRKFVNRLVQRLKVVKKKVG